MINSPVGALISQSSTGDRNINYIDEAALAIDMAMLQHWMDIINTGKYDPIISTRVTKKLLYKICEEAIESRILQANGIAQARNRETVGYRDKIDDLNNEIHRLEQRLAQKEARRARNTTSVSDTGGGSVTEIVERHTPIPDHASGAHNHD